MMHLKDHLTTTWYEKSGGYEKWHTFCTVCRRVVATVKESTP